jgi:hypothetical protein
LFREPRVNLNIPFTKLRRRPSAAFRELDKEPVYLPILDVMVISKSRRRLRTFALLDTGAGVTIFGTQHAEDLGIEWKECPTIDVIGLGGDSTGYAEEVKLVIPASNYAWDVKMVFSPGIDAAKGAWPVLGHNGFFEHFEVRFKNRRFSVRLD